jgi:hypothetical protein
VWYVFGLQNRREVKTMQKKLLTGGNVFRRTDKRRGGTVWYMDEQGQRKRKSFSGTTNQLYCVKKDTARLSGITDGFEL